MEIVPLHCYPHLIEQCCNLLNSQWPRSRTARLHSLEKSCDNLPCSLVLIEGKDQVIGHSKLSRLPERHDVCFVESVIVQKERRGQGLGKLIMHQTEAFAKRLGFEYIALTTHDKQDFYRHLGYSFCEPFQLFGKPKCAGNQILSSPTSSKVVVTPVKNVNLPEDIVCSAPKPPPLPCSSQNKCCMPLKQWMMKSLTSYNIS